MSTSQTFYTSTGKAIPLANITKTYLHTCDYKHTETCGRCGGTGKYSNLGVCFSCKGAGKVLVKSKGYTADKLVEVVLAAKAEKAKLEEGAAAREEAKRLAGVKDRNTYRIKTAIRLGGNESNFANDLGEKVWHLMRGDRVSLSDKQMVYVTKFLKAGCKIQGYPFDKVMSDVKEKLA